MAEEEKTERLKTALTIAGSDPSGGAGIQADLKTMTVWGVYGMSAVTALTAQNTCGVSRVEAVSPDLLEAQLESVFSDIVPDAVKIGMLPDAALMEMTARVLRRYGCRQVVLDPVMVATSGDRLMEDSAADAMKRTLLPLARLVTPNLPEVERLSGLTIADRRDMEEAARRIHAQGAAAVLIKGGHRTGDADDLLYDGTEFLWLRGARIDNPNTHGTGCTLSSAIACGLALGLPLPEAVRRAKEWLSGAIRAGLKLGHGRGPLNHMYGNDPVGHESLAATV